MTAPHALALLLVAALLPDLAACSRESQPPAPPAPPATAPPPNSPTPVLDTRLTLGDIAMTTAPMLAVSGSGDTLSIATAGPHRLQVFGPDGQLRWTHTPADDRYLRSLRRTGDGPALVVTWQNTDATASGTTRLDLTDGTVLDPDTADTDNTATAHDAARSADGQWSARFEDAPIEHTNEPDGTRVYYETAGTVTLTHLPSGAQWEVARIPGGASAVAFTPDSTTLLAAGGGQLTAWPLQTSPPGPQDPRSAPDPGNITSLAVAPDGDLVATGNTTPTVSLWRLPRLERVASDARFTGEVTAVAFSDDGQRLVAASRTDAVRLYEVPSLTDLTPGHGHRAAVTALAVVPDDARLVSAGADGRLHLWHTDDGRLLDTLDLGAPVADVAVDRREGGVQITTFVPAHRGAPARLVHISLDGDRWDTQRTVTLELAIPGDLDTAGARLLTRTLDGDLTVLDTTDGTKLALQGVAGNDFEPAHFVEGTDHQAVVVDSDAVSLVDLRTGLAVLSCPRPSAARVTSLAAAPGGRALAWSTWDTVQWCRATGDAVDSGDPYRMRLDDLGWTRTPLALAWSRSGDHLFAGHGDAVTCLDVDRGAPASSVSLGAGLEVRTLRVIGEDRLAVGTAQGRTELLEVR